jgi:hypothetical protein
VVGTDSVTNTVWTPWPEPIFKRQGHICLSVPITGEQQFFKLVPGTQFSDDFRAPRWPYASKGEWLTVFNNNADAARLVLTNIDGALRYQSIKTPVDGRCQMTPPGPEVVVGDFSASLDILDWDPNALNQAVSIAVRLLDSTRPDSGYYGIAYLNYNNKGNGELHLYAPGKANNARTCAVTPGKKYRLRFSGVGSKLLFGMYDLANLEQPLAQVPLTEKTWSHGSVILAMSIGTPSTAIAVDNFFVTGTKP